jgi:hypothetical protein
MTITEFSKACEHVAEFVDVKIRYAGKEKFSCVLNIKGKPIATIGGLDARGNVIDLKWKSRSFRVPREVIFGAKGKKIPRRSILLKCMKRHVGHWELKGGPGRKSKGSLSKVVCPECWGEKVSLPPPAIDIRKEAEELLKDAQPDENLKLEVQMLIAKYGKKPQLDKKVSCTYCNGEGKVKLEDGSGRYKRHEYIFNLGVKKPESFSEEKAAQQTKDFKTIDAYAKKVVEKEQELTKGIAVKRLIARREKAVEELKELVNKHKKKLALTMFTELETIEWKAPAEIEGTAVGTGGVDLKRAGMHGHKPKTLFDLPVRRMTEWKRLVNFRPLGRLGTNDFAVGIAYYRLVEIGGDPLPKKEPEDKEDKKKKKKPSRRRRQGPPPEEGQEDVKAEQEEEEEEGPKVPADLWKRKFVIQYAVTIQTHRNHKKYIAAVSLTVKFTENPQFRLSDKEKVLILKNTHTLGRQWDGDLIGAELLSLNQLYADIGGRNAVVVGVKITKK